MRKQCKIKNIKSSSESRHQCVCVCKLAQKACSQLQGPTWNRPDEITDLKLVVPINFNGPALSRLSIGHHPK